MNGPVAVPMFLLSLLTSTGAPAPGEDAYVATLRDKGREPVELVASAFDEHDLVIFDDGLHNALEPWTFYTRLLQDARVGARVRWVFLETVSLAAQPALDAYLASPTGDRGLLAPVFQDDYSGFGWRYATLLDFLATVWKLNHGRPEAERIRVAGVSPPIYWEALHTRRDYDVFQDSLLGRDYSMYVTIRARLDGFAKGTKALFLTNTRHAYARVRNADGRLQGNTAHFFAELDPGKSVSVRIHNAALFVEAPAKPIGNRTAAGMEDVRYHWARMEDGAWDRAFAKRGNRPVAFWLADTPFGKARFVGNTMLSARGDQRMVDAYDALVFLAPLDDLHSSATTGFYVTEAFRPELARRIRLVEGDGLADTLKGEGCKTLDELLDKLSQDRPAARSTVLDATRP